MPTPTPPPPLSSGCALLNDPAYDETDLGIVSERFLGGLEFNAGETVRFAFDIAGGEEAESTEVGTSSGGVTTIRYQGSYIEGYPQSYAYTFDGTEDGIYWRHEQATSVYDVTVEVSCGL